jgi:thioredoxin-dependent peroxiredoxin
VSSDEFDRQCEFARSLELSFALLPDPDGAIARKYRARRLLVSLDKRITYIIDPAGTIAAAFRHELDAGKHEASVRAYFTERLGPPAPEVAPGGDD